jgi:branched-chain amino acid transport system ATP-binding protein
LLESTGLIRKANILAGSLTLLERKRLEMARALATKPKVLLLDEIAGGLTEYEVKELIETISEIHAQGISIIWIEHIVHALMSVVDRLVVINFGQKLDDGDPEVVFNSPKVQKVYMGISIE